MHELTMMKCDRQGLTLTTVGCSRLWLSVKAKKPDPWEGRAHCLGCPIGATHAGQPITAAEVASVDWANICPRCLRTAGRLIGGHFCVSCYNRHCEAMRGKNAKGNVPQICAQLHTANVAIIEGNKARTIRQKAVLSPVEVMIQAVKSASATLAFGVARYVHPVLQPTQLCLAL